VADEPTPWGYTGSSAPDVLRILGWVIAICCTVASLLLLLHAQSLGSVGDASAAVYCAAAAVFGAGLVSLGTLVGVGATLEHTIAIRAHLDGSVTLRPPARAAAPPAFQQQLFDVRLIAAGEHLDRVARELRRSLPADRIPELMANLPATVAESVGYATREGAGAGADREGCAGRGDPPRRRRLTVS
jgi:hypothetical protein